MAEYGQSPRASVVKALDLFPEGGEGSVRAAKTSLVTGTPSTFEVSILFLDCHF